MSIMSALFSGSSGLTTYGDAMAIIGNNLANTNTIAYKGARISFEDTLSQTVGRTVAQGSNQVGNGVDVAAISPQMTPGAVEPTENAIDLSIDGQGFFVVTDYSASQEGANYFTRAGDFKISTQQKLVTNQGLILQGKELDINDNPVGTLVDLDLGKHQTIPSETTSLIDLAVSLDAAVTTKAIESYDPTNAESYHFSTSLRIYDSLGDGHNVEVQFIKTSNNTWEWFPVVESTDLAAAARDTATRKLTAVDANDLAAYQLPASPTKGIRQNVQAVPAGATYSHGILSFASNGALTSEGSTPVTFAWDNGSAPQEVLFNFGGALNTAGDSTNDFTSYDKDPTSATFLTFRNAVNLADTDNTGINGTVQYSSGFTTIAMTQDGFPAGFLASLSVDDAGKIYGSYTNGRVRAVYQLVIATFANQEALDRIGDNLFQETHVSGQPVVGMPNSGRTGAILSHSLEQSNVDMSDQFVKMISVQRGFQANSRIITVTDDMLDELINLKR